MTDDIEVSQWMRDIMQTVEDCPNPALRGRAKNHILIDDYAALVEDLSRGAFLGGLTSTPVVAGGGEPLGSTADGSVVIWLDELGLGVTAPDPRWATEAKTL
jgi:hypothetical protein